MAKDFECGHAIKKKARCKRRVDYDIMQKPKNVDSRAKKHFKRKPYTVNLQNIEKSIEKCK